MADVWNISQVDVPGFLPRLARSLSGLVIIGGAFIVNAALATFATGTGYGNPLLVLVLIGMLLVNGVLYVAAFRLLTPDPVTGPR
jgi:hypothetical protein